MKNFRCLGVAVFSLNLALSAVPATAQRILKKTTVAHGAGKSMLNPSIPPYLPLQFDQGTSYQTGGTKPIDVAVGDFNHDGKLDLVVVNQDQDTVAVMLGNGNGTFAAPVIYNLPPGVPMQVAVADFNNDGHLDIAVITASVDGITSEVIVLLGSGNGSFGTPISTVSGVSGLTIHAADVNGDGKQDVVIGGNGSAAILYGKGNGTFQAPVLLSSGSYSLVDVAAGDFNGDGRLDVVCAIANPNAGIAVFLQNPDGSFSPGQVLLTQYPAGAAVAVADFNQNGKLGVLLNAVDQLQFLAGNGDGTFQQPALVYGGGSTGPIALADFNRDGLIDYTAANYNQPGWGVLMGAQSEPGFFGWNVMPATTKGGTSGVAVGDFNGDGWPDVVSADSIGNRVTVFLNLVGVNNGPVQFVAIPPCRLFDSRPNPLSGGIAFGFTVSEMGSCGASIPPSAAAFSLNVTAIPVETLNYMEVFSPGGSFGTFSTLNSPDGRTKADAVIVAAGAQAAFGIYDTDSTNVIVDLNGYFQPATQSTLTFYPVTECRVFDTRNANGPLGGPYLHGGGERDFPVLASDCQIPSDAQAYSMNFTAVPYDGQELGYLTVWGKGSPRPGVSTLNNPTATIVANAAIVQAGTGGEVAVYPSNNTQLVGDINGYFAPAQSGGLSLYALQPCRALDTRQQKGAFNGELTVGIENSPCAVSGTAQAYVLNATVVPVAPLYYLTLWPDGQGRPEVSTLNAVDGEITSNMAIVATGDGRDRCLCFGPHQFDPRPLRLFRAIARLHAVPHPGRLSLGGDFCLIHEGRPNRTRGGPGFFRPNSYPRKAIAVSPACLLPSLEQWLNLGPRLPSPISTPIAGMPCPRASSAGRWMPSTSSSSSFSSTLWPLTSTFPSATSCSASPRRWPCVPSAPCSSA